MAASTEVAISLCKLIPLFTAKYLTCVKFCNLCRMIQELPVHILSEVAEALHEGRPVVALESTIIAHGMPFPDNLATARRMEQIIRSSGAIPATIAIMHGKIQIGLSDSQMTFLAESGQSAGKVSRRDMSRYLADDQLLGATTVSSTMIGAALAGIRVFATGGIGGVHRGDPGEWDVSADLMEFTKSPVAVVSAGAKAILDLPATLEYLETLGVPVIGYDTLEFPAFYSRSSGLQLLQSFDNTGSLARQLYLHWKLFPSSGVLITQPVPPEDEIPAREIEPVIQSCIAEAKSSGVTGKNLTPFLLKRIAEVTAGRSLRANISLALNNAGLAARLARSLSEVRG
jgi:pseudouridylate synthase